MPGGAKSSPTITVAPVVVTPDTDSKRASTGSSLSSENWNGSAPKTTMTSHARLVSRNAWRTEKRLRLARVVSIMETPTNSVTPAATRNTCQSGCPTAMSTMAGMTIAMASTDSRMPRMKTMGRSSVMRGYPRQAVLHPVDCVPPHHAESQVRSAAAVPQAARRAYERKEFPACGGVGAEHAEHAAGDHGGDRKSKRLNSSH